ncbi:MAG TPA: hypothetical protein VFQ39_06970 [Longimicrobium sp.]|nr:hypothetical protein [Longimicrobium sp.]
MVNATELLEPVLGDGIRLTNFFNGRILTAEDLRTDQQANRAQHRQLARALGEGVAHGLEVSASTSSGGTPALSILPGLAFNRDGDAVALGRAVELRLVPAAEAANAEAGLFAVCRQTGEELELTNVGLYVLTVSPASGLSGERAPMAEFGSEGVAGGCASRWAVEGARFSVAPLPLAPAGETPTPLAEELAALVEDVEENVELVLRGGASDTPAVRTALDRALSKLRSGAAYLCFGADRLASQRANPFAGTTSVLFPGPTYGAVDGMRERGEVKSCEAPLALFYLGKRGVEWVDAWAVRRPLVPALGPGSLSVLFDRRRRAEALAMVLQFQAQAAELSASSLTTAQLTLIEAKQRFRFLPPVGVVPLREGGAGRGFAHAVFFKELSLGAPQTLSGAKLSRVVEEALPLAPVDLSSAANQVLLWRVRDNLPVAGQPAPPPYAVFVTREAQGPRVTDAVATVLRTAWAAWRGVLRKRLFLPTSPATDSIGMLVSVMSAVRDVMDVASRQGALATAGALDVPGALDALREMHAIQDDLRAVFNLDVAGVGGTNDRKQFAQGIGVRLNTAIPGGGRALLPALNLDDLAGAVAAQVSINQFVANYSGEGVAIGPIEVTYVSSPRGTNMVPGDAEGFPHHFTVRNGTDRGLVIHLEGSATAPTADWSNAVTLEDATGGAIVGGELQVATGQTATVVARVRPPAAAAVGEAVELRLRATVDPPNDRDVSATRALAVAASEGGSTAGAVEVTPPNNLPFPNMDDADADTVATFPFHVRYTGPTSLPETIQATVTVTTASAQAALWRNGEIAGVPFQALGNNFTATLSLDRGESTLLDFLLRTPASASAATVTVAVTAVVNGQTLTGGLTAPIALRVR